MIESAMVFDDRGEVIAYHTPPGCTSGSIPDTRSLWEILWEHRAHLGGVAHVHPWNGEPHPSTTDVTTFRAIENGLGKLLLWPVVTFDQVGVWVWDGPESGYIRETEWSIKIEGIEKLRELSR